jgi:hypothetical protein
MAGGFLNPRHLAMNPYAKYAIVFVVILAAIIFLHNLFDPPDWVELHLVEVPLDVKEIYVIARGREGDTPLKWYHAKLIPFVSDAREAGQQWYWTVTGDRRKGDVQWISADSYGVLARRNSGEWVVWWLKPEDVRKPSSLRYLIGGRVRATIRTSGIETARLAPKSLTDKVKK